MAGSYSCISSRSGVILSGSTARFAAGFTPSDMTDIARSFHVKKLDSIVSSGIRYRADSESFWIGSGPFSSTSSVPFMSWMSSASSTSESSSLNCMSSRSRFGGMTTFVIASSNSLIRVSVNQIGFPS